MKEEERRKLARYFAVSEAVLGGPAEEAVAARGLVSAQCYPVSVSWSRCNRHGGAWETRFRF